MSLLIRIELGNDAMRTPEDVRCALASIQLPADDDGDVLKFPTRDLRDLNGNTIGSVSCY